MELVGKTNRCDTLMTRMTVKEGNEMEQCPNAGTEWQLSEYAGRNEYENGGVWGDGSLSAFEFE